MTAVLVLTAHELVKALRLRQIQRVQYQRIHDAKHHGVGANRQGQRRDGGHRESGRLAQEAQAVAHIMDESFDKVAAQRLVTFLPEPFKAAELDARATFRFGAIQDGAFQIVSAVLDVGAKLLRYVFFNPRTMKKLGGNGTNIGREFHDSSGCAARAEAMASARRFHPSTSSRKRLRPAEVSS